MNKSITLITALFALCVACKRIDVDFSYNPTTPKAGEVVTFSNLSTAGEKWAWNFGDNESNLAKNPKHIYKKPGTYLVTLMVDSSKYHTCTREITVYDTVPTFVCSTDSILHYQEVVFTANVFNPYNQTLTYEWSVSDNCEVLSTTNTGQKLRVLFKSPTAEESVQLTLSLNGKKHEICHTYEVHLTQAPAIVQQLTNHTILRQRMINDRIEMPTPATKNDAELIDNCTDTSVNFNGTTFYASTIASVINGFQGMNIQRIQLDAMAQKWYIITHDGLFVSNFDGSNLVSIDPKATGAIYVDATRNRILWASTKGLMGMPLVKSKNNQFTTQPLSYNDIDNIALITVNNTPQ
jgi:PKD repeat protein